MRTWQRLEHRWDTRKRAERDKSVAAAEVALSEAQIAEQLRDRDAFWDAFSVRLASDEGYTHYESVARTVWTRAGLPPWKINFFELYQRMRDGRPVDREPFIAYLERDPWEVNSGYIKERIIQFLKKGELSRSDRSRLQQVLLHVVDARYRREFRRYCGLARKVDAPELRAALRVRFGSADADIRRRAAWMLFALGEREPNLAAWQR